MPKGDNLLTVLDVGTSKVTVLVANPGEDGSVQFVGKGVSETQNGIIAGSVVNMEATKEAVVKAVTEAEKVSDIHIRSAVLGLSGEHISSINSHGVVTVRTKEVTASDVERVIEQAKNISLPSDRRIVGVEIAGFVVDEQHSIKNPKGMAGRRLEAKIHIITASIAMIQNLVKSVNDAGIQVEDIVVNSLASGYAVLTEDEKQLGVALVDIGEGTTDITVYSDGNPIYTTVIPMGGDYITKDISYAIRIPPMEAERIKLEYGSAISEMVSSDEEVEVEVIGGGAPKIIRSQALAGVVAPRVEEIMMTIRKKINEDLKENMISTGVVLTGGTAKLKYINTLAEDVLGLAVRIGNPRVSDDNLGIAPILRDPCFASAVGIVYYFIKHGGVKIVDSTPGIATKIGGFFKRFFE